MTIITVCNNKKLAVSLCSRSYRHCGIDGV